MLWYVGVLVLTPVIAASALYLGLLSDVWYASGIWRIFYVGMGIVLVVGFLRRFQSRRIPMANLSHGVTAVGDQSLRLPPRSLGTLTFWARMDNPKVTFISSDHRDRAAGLIEDVGIEVSSEYTDAKYKFFKGGGGYYCPTCNAAVSRRDTYCDSCQTQLREDMAH